MQQLMAFLFSHELNDTHHGGLGIKSNFAAGIFHPFALPATAAVGISTDSIVHIYSAYM